MAVGSGNLAELKTYAFEQITISSTALRLGAGRTTGQQPLYALVQCETGQIRYTLDGETVPTATVGMLLDVGTAVEVWGLTDIQNFRAIRVSVDSQLNVTYAKSAV